MTLLFLSVKSVTLGKITGHFFISRCM